VTARQVALLGRFGLPTAPQRWPVEELLRVMRSDKKNVAGRLRLVLPRRLGEVALFDDVPDEAVRGVLEEMLPIVNTALDSVNAR
jgi:3-dehydroquinate synthetase